MRYAPGKVPARPLPAAPSRPTIQQQVGGTRPMGTGTPQIPPQNINPIRPGVGGTRPRPTPPVIGIKPPPQNYIGPRDAMGYPTSSTTVQPRGTPQPNQNPLYTGPGIKKMGMKKGGKVSSASKRADGCAIKGKTKGKMV
jgi:hypothetical protein